MCHIPHKLRLGHVCRTGPLIGLCEFGYHNAVLTLTLSEIPDIYIKAQDTAQQND